MQPYGQTSLVVSLLEKLRRAEEEALLHQFDYVEGVNKFGSKVSRYLLKQKRTFVTRASISFTTSARLWKSGI